MNPESTRPSGTSKRLFTPGPLTTSQETKQAMLHDVGSRDASFIKLVNTIRDELLALGGVSRQAGYECIPMQGSGTYGIEAVLSTAVPMDGKLLVLVNGAYGERMVKIAERHSIPWESLKWPENECPDPEATAQALSLDPDITHVAAVHCETTTGIINPVAELGKVVQRHQRQFIVDAMSSFGAVPLQIDQARIDYLISSANKCIEGIPGFAFVLARKQALLDTEGQARTLSLDLLEQWQGLEKNGQFRFTPPTHAILAFAQALRELGTEGGPAGRAARYQSNHETLLAGMNRLGFQSYLPAHQQSYIITTFLYPADPRFDFARFYDRLSEKGFIIYPGKLTRANAFRIGTIGRLQPADVTALLQAMAEVLGDMGCTLPLQRPKA